MSNWVENEAKTLEGDVTNMSTKTEEEIAGGVALAAVAGAGAYEYEQHEKKKKAAEEAAQQQTFTDTTVDNSGVQDTSGNY